MCLKQFFFWAALVLSSLLAVFFAVPYIVVCFLLWRNIHKAARNYIHYYGSLFLFLASPAMPVRIDRPQLPIECAPCIIALNHQSFLDIYMLSAQGSKNVVQVVRSWPFRKLFFFAPFMYLAGYIDTESATEEGFVERCSRVLNSGANIVCFPEGTRSRNGELLPFYSGIFRVAAEAKVPVVPMVLHNTGDVCRPGGLALSPREVCISVLDPITPEMADCGEKTHIQLKKLTHAAMLSALERGKAGRRDVA